MRAHDVAFWIFFGWIVVLVAWSFFRMLLRRRGDQQRALTSQRKTDSHSAAGGVAMSAGIGLVDANATDLSGIDASDSDDSGDDSGGDDTGGGDSGGGDFSGGGGDSGGGGGSGGW